VELDPRDFEVALEQAQAQLLKAQAEERAQNPNLPITQSNSQTNISTSQSEVANAEAAIARRRTRPIGRGESRVLEVEANNAKAQADVARYQTLVDKNEVSRSEYDQVMRRAKALAASVNSARASAESAQKVVEQRRAQLARARSMMESAQVNAPNQVAISQANLQSKQADVQSMQAQVDQAQLDLSYCKIVAPVAGVVSKRTVEVGEHVSKGQRLVTLADLGDLWVTANFKESQLRQMHPGQSVTFPWTPSTRNSTARRSHARRDRLVTSLLPPENATGNYVKVVQRLPVRIRLKPGQPGLDRLRPGMSVVPKVWP
jgi:membrane fusion protein (multidrug efflux system)